MPKKFHHGHRPPSRPITPASTDRGLASPVNVRYTLEILRASDRGQIDHVLRQAGYGSNGPRTGGPPDAGVEVDALRYLQSDEGRRARAAAVDRLVQQAAAAELASPAGRARVEEAKARLAARTLADDVDVFARLCQEEVRRHVDAWMQGPAGREAVELAKQSAADREARTSRFARRPLREGASS